MACALTHRLLWWGRITLAFTCTGVGYWCRWPAALGAVPSALCRERSATAVWLARLAAVVAFTTTSTTTTTAVGESAFTIDLLNLPATDVSLKGFHDGSTGGTYGYLVPGNNGADFLKSGAVYAQPLCDSGSL
jgi:hypothetical protein